MAEKNCAQPIGAKEFHAQRTAQPTSPTSWPFLKIMICPLSVVLGQSSFSHCSEKRFYTKENGVQYCRIEVEEG